MSKIKECKICKAKLAWTVPKIPDIVLHSSDGEPDWSICRSCMIEHCVSTNCLQCEYGKYPDCRFFKMKVFYTEKENF